MFDVYIPPLYFSLFHSFSLFLSLVYNRTSFQIWFLFQITPTRAIICTVLHPRTNLCAQKTSCMHIERAHTHTHTHTRNFHLRKNSRSPPAVLLKVPIKSIWEINNHPLIWSLLPQGKHARRLNAAHARSARSLFYLSCAHSHEPLYAERSSALLFCWTGSHFSH